MKSLASASVTSHLGQATPRSTARSFNGSLVALSVAAAALGWSAPVRAESAQAPVAVAPATSASNASEQPMVRLNPPSPAIAPSPAGRSHQLRVQSDSKAAIDLGARSPDALSLAPVNLDALIAQSTPTIPLPPEPAPTPPIAPPSAPPTVAPDPAPTSQTEPGFSRREDARYRLSYVGAGANIGIVGGAALGDAGFTVLSKFQLNSYLSFRPSLIFSGDVGILLPVTYDFNQSDGSLPRVMPYAGIGAGISTGDDSEIDFLLTAGVDIPLSRQLTATAGINITPFDSFDMGVQLGLAYNFESRAVEAPTVSLGEAARERLSTLLPDGTRATNPSFLGLGVNLGIGGDDALGSTSFAILSKFTFNERLSFRPEVMLGDNVTFLLPFTYDFPYVQVGSVSLAPYLGAGLAFATGDDSNFDLLLTSGVDIPIGDNFGTTIALSITPFNSFDIGLRLGLYYVIGR